MGAAVATAGMAAPVAAQSASELDGTYVFASSLTRVSGGLGQISGVMTVNRYDDGEYHVRLNTIEHVDDGTRQNKSFSLQSCRGRDEGEDIVITCEVLNSTPGYQPDTLRIRYVGGVQFAGQLISADTYPIEVLYHSDGN